MTTKGTTTERAIRENSAPINRLGPAFLDSGLRRNDGGGQECQSKERQPNAPFIKTRRPLTASAPFPGFQPSLE